MKEEETKKSISTDTIQLGEFIAKIKGTTPLLMERMPPETMQGMINKMEGKGADKKKIKDFNAEIENKIHRNEKGEVGFPAGGFKKAMVEAAPYLDDMDKKLARSIVVVGDLVKINYKSQIINKAIGKDSGIKKSPRPIWRPQFNDWSCDLLIRYNGKLITPQQIIGLIKLAGFHIGVGGWTPQHNGSYGMFTVA
jgi:hypothetical protein